MGYELFAERNDLMAELSASIEAMERHGAKKAGAERDYKVALAQTALRLKDSGMTATMVGLTVYGQPEVAKLRFERDLAETMHDTAEQKIQAIKLRLRLVEAQIEREWAQAKREV